MRFKIKQKARLKIYRDFNGYKRDRQRKREREREIERKSKREKCNKILQ